MDRQLLSRENSLILRGLAILTIMYHNFLHLSVFGFCKENEMSFEQERVDTFFSELPSSGFHVVFEVVSFLGWIGVPVFVFLTGYGLSIKYPLNVRIDKRKYLKNCYLKLFFLLLPAVLFFSIFDIWNGLLTDLIKRAIELTMLYNLDYPHLCVSPGVYWYFSLTFQYYVLYCFCRKWLNITNLLIFSVLSLLLLYPLVVMDMPNTLSIYRHCFTGWFPVFALGIWFVNDERPIRLIEKISTFTTCLLLLLMPALIVIMQLNVISWLISPVVSFFFFVLFAKLIVNTRYVSELFKWIGGVSAYLFVCHPMARQICIIFHMSNYGICVSLFVYTVMTFIIALFYQKIHKQLVTKFKVIQSI